MLRDLQASLPQWPNTFAQPTLQLEDSFYYSEFLTFETLTEMVWYISDRYMGGSAFHIRLETTNGDTYLALKFRELRYFFQQQRNNLWMLDLYSATYDGQQLFLRLWFHPLSKEPNAHVQLVSQYAEEILELIHHTIGTEEPESTEQQCLHRAFSFSPSRFKIFEFVSAVKYISDYLLDGVHTVGHVSTESGLRFSGLSRYQLLRLVPEYQNQLTEVSIGIIRLITGQRISLVLRFNQDDGIAYQSIMWGNSSLQERIHDELQTRLDLQPLSSPPGFSSAADHSWALDGGGSDLLQWRLDSWAAEQELSLIPVQTSYSHKAWEERIGFIRATRVWLTDMSFPSPEKWYYAGLAHLLGKQVVFISQTQLQPSREFQGVPVLTYSSDEEGIRLLLQELEDFVV